MQQNVCCKHPKDTRTSSRLSDTSLISAAATRSRPHSPPAAKAAMLMLLPCPAAGDVKQSPTKGRAVRRKAPTSTAAGLSVLLWVAL
eukprot:1154291-Pelagomonas_calceolata.AAC.6